MGASTPACAERLARIIEREGPISFARFMREALYGPGGFYHSAIRAGRDFHTAPRICPSFGRLLATAVTRVLGEQGGSVVELGAHDGTLARQLLASLPPQIEYIGVETGEAPRRALEQVLSSVARPARAIGELPRERIAEKAVVIAHEFFDALPCHRVVMTREGIQEWFVARRGGRFGFRRGRLSRPEIIEHLAEEGVRLRIGQSAEVCLEVERLYRTLARSLPRAVLLAIDYGYEARELYSPLRRQGTLRGYRGQRESENVLSAPGSQDLTYHVDVTRLQMAGRKVGFQTVRLLSQAEFLLGLGALGLMVAVPLEERLALKSLINPGDMGARFRVLIQSRGIRIGPGTFPDLRTLVGLAEQRPFGF